MCYYEQTAYVCKDWKWGNMKERCPRQHRMGETCGVKLVHHDFLTHSPDLCRTCRDKEVKERKLKKEQQNIERWRKEGRKFIASIEKAENEVEHLEEQIRVLESNRASNKMGLQSRQQDVMHASPRHNTVGAAHHMHQVKDALNRHGGQSGSRHGSQSSATTQSSQSGSNNRHASLPYRATEHGKSDRHGHG